jgi:beta-lactamase class D
MKWIIIPMCFLQFFPLNNLQAADNQLVDSCLFETSTSFIFYDPAEDKPLYIHHPEGCAIPASPCSTFKIPLALMGYDAGVLVDEETPQWSYEEGDVECPRVQGMVSPETWMRYSCVWYSQILARRLGMPLMQDYLALFGYGNQQMRGNAEKGDDLELPWICSSLEISLNEQIGFLNRLVFNQLGVSPSAVNQAKRILFLQELPNGWKLYGKTGTGHCRNSQGVYDENVEQGWFIGWIERDGLFFTFAARRTFPEQPPSGPASWIVRDAVIGWLKEWQKPSPDLQSIPMSMHVGN